MSDRKQYDSVAELLADTIDESDLRDWIKTLWDEQRELRGIAFEHVQTIHGLEAALAKMPRTPDGVLVVLGETVVWRIRHDGVVLHGVAVGIDVADKTVHAKWYAGDEYAYEQTVAMSHCYGSESALIAGKENDEH